MRGLYAAKHAFRGAYPVVKLHASRGQRDCFGALFELLHGSCIVSRRVVAALLFWIPDTRGGNSPHPVPGF